MIKKLVLSLVAVLSVAAMAVAQNQQVSGRVSGEDGSPIIGATVVEEGSGTNGTSTDVAGEFTLRVPANANLVVSFIGYESQTIAVNGQTTIDVVLKEDTQSIDDVIVVAFGEAKKEAFTGSAGVVKSDDIAKVQTSNVAQALAGQVAGVQLTQSSGQLGGSPTIRVRGFGSINAGQEPLVIVDGAPFEGDLNNINPADIESMTVLKDAASNALYGARGANGVIMITTKRARVNDAVVTVDAKWGVNSRATQQYDYIDDPALYYETHYNALYNAYVGELGEVGAWQRANAVLTGPSGDGGLGYQIFTVPEGQYFIGSNGRVNPNAKLGRVVNYRGRDYYLTSDNWNDEAYKSGFRQEYNVSMSGATERSNVYASFGYLNNKGIVDNSDMFRYTARLKADFQAKKWLKMGANVNYTNYNWNSLTDDGNSASSANVFAFTESVAPIYPVYIRDANGNVMRDEHGIMMYDYGAGTNAGMVRPYMSNFNALQDSRLNVNNSRGNAMTGSIYADVTPLEGLKITVKADMNFDEWRSTSMNNKYYGQYATSGGAIAKGHNRSYSYNFQQLISYSKVFKDVHALDVMLGHEYYNSQSASLSGSKTGMLFDDNYELPNASQLSGTSSSTGEYNVEGYFGRVQYDYDGRVFVSGSYRRDASSVFHPDHRWGNFWSVGAAWLLSRESWFESSWVDMLKVKFSIGSQGNDSIGSFRYTNTYGLSSFDGNTALIFSAPGNENITWETNTNMNVGVEFDFFKGRLSGGVDYFYRTTTDMLFSFPVAPSLGYSSYYANVGDLRNSGIEVNLNAVLMQKKNFMWTFNVNMTHLKNKITMLPEGRKTAGISKATGAYVQPNLEGKFDEDVYRGFASGSYFYGEGMSLYTLMMQKYAGVSQDGLPMWYQVTLDEKNQKVLTPTTTYQDADYFECGNSIPDLYGGFGMNFAFYGVDISANFTYQIGGQTYDSGYAGAMASPNASSVGNNWHKDILKAWTNDAKNPIIPRLQYGDLYSSAMSDRFLVDASYLNIQNIQVGYTIPQTWAAKIGVHSLRIYLACDNVYYWSYRRGLDPRQSYSGGSNNTSYAPIRTISGGITVQF